MRIAVGRVAGQQDAQALGLQTLHQAFAQDAVEKTATSEADVRHLQGIGGPRQVMGQSIGQAQVEQGGGFTCRARSDRLLHAGVHVEHARA